MAQPKAAAPRANADGLSANKSAIERAATWVGFAFALAGLTVSAWSLHETRRQNRLGVRPHLSWGIDTDTRTGKVEWFLMNDGVGPAVIGDWDFDIDGVMTKNLVEVNERLGEHNVCRMSGMGFAVGAYLAPGRYEYMRAGPGLDGSKMIDRLSRVHLTMCYCSIYDECWVFAHGKNVPTKSCSIK